MSEEATSNPYAAFGVHNSVVGGGDPIAHQQAMLELNVAARDGDDAIDLADEDEDEILEGELVEDGEDSSFDNSEGNEESTGEDGIQAIGEMPAELKETTKALEQHEAGFNELVNQAIERGLSPDVVDQVQTEYAAGGLSAKTYAALAEAGYSQTFVDSYIAGQEALAGRYVDDILRMAGGQANYAKVVKHLSVASPEAVDSLNRAIEGRDIGTVKAILTMASSSRVKIMGKPAARTITNQAKQAAPAPQGVQGYSSKAEMVRDMSSAEYRSNPKFRAQVHAKVAHSEF